MSEKGKKILVLSASPQRDKVVDDLLAEELRRMGNQVWVKPCLRQGRQAVLELKPDVVVLPPIRNPYSRDLAETLKSWGIGVVSRHTEASTDWQDFKKMNGMEKSAILGRWSYNIDVEIVWSEDEADILRRRGCGFPIVAVGALMLDIYYRDDLDSRFLNRPNFNKKFGFKKKKTLLIACPWGFADSAPDLQIDPIGTAKKDVHDRPRHIAMIQEVYRALSAKWNILVTLHPGVVHEPYRQALGKLKIPIDTESTATELLKNSDALIHSGSTMAMEMHALNRPAFQYGDVNIKGEEDWWGRESPLSKISPKFDNVTTLYQAIATSKRRTNANKDVLKILEAGRYGRMDGGAVKRAAEVINKVRGKFKMCWPRAHRDYDQPLVVKNAEKILKPKICGICKYSFFMVANQWLQHLGMNLKLAPQQMKTLFAMKQECCPHCSAKFYDRNDNPGPLGQPATAVQDRTATAEGG